MKYAIVDVFYSEKLRSIGRIRYDNSGEGYPLSDACDLMRNLVRENPDTHYPYLEYIER